MSIVNNQSLMKIPYGLIIGTLITFWLARLARLAAGLASPILAIFLKQISFQLGDLNPIMASYLIVFILMVYFARGTFLGVYLNVMKEVSI